MDSGWLDLDLVEAGYGQLVSVVGFVEGSGDTADPEKHAAANFGLDFAAGDDVGDGEAATGLEDSEGFAQDLSFVGREIDHAVGDDYVHGVVGQRDVLDLALEKFHVFGSRFALVLVCQGKHFVGHVEAIGFAGSADTAGGTEAVKASDGTEVENNLAGVQTCQCGWIAAA